MTVGSENLKTWESEKLARLQILRISAFQPLRFIKVTDTDCKHGLDVLLRQKRNFQSARS
jgi:hypothetical protein